MIISCDQGATKITGYFLYFGGITYDFRTYEGENWLSHVEDGKKLLEKHKPSLFIFEDAKQFPGNKEGFVNFHYRNVLKAGGAMEYVCHELNIPRYGIFNANEWRTQAKAKRGEIPGLVKKREWWFKERKITVHEKDAFLLFYIWCQRNNKPWPWI